MLASVVIKKRFVSDVYIDDISDVKCQFHLIHLEQYFIQQKPDQNRQHLCLHYCVFTSVDIHLLG